MHLLRQTALYWRQLPVCFLGSPGLEFISSRIPPLILCSSDLTRVLCFLNQCSRHSLCCIRSLICGCSVCFGPHCTACGILVLWPGIEPKPLEWERTDWTNHWTAREFPNLWMFWCPPLNLGFPVAQLGKNAPAMREAWVRSLGWEDALEMGKATHSMILAWRIQRVAKSQTRLSYFHLMINFLKKGLCQC